MNSSGVLLSFAKLITFFARRSFGLLETVALSITIARDSLMAIL